MADIFVDGDGNVIGNHNRVQVIKNTVIVRGENVRDRERASLHGLVSRYERWCERYTPLAGIAEVREAVTNGSLFDHEDPFIPPEFEKLVEHGFGPRTEVRREPVDDLRTAIREHRRIILLGDPGSGKTTTLWRLTYDYAEVALEDPQAPLPVFVRLGEYTSDEPFREFLRRHLGPLAPYLESYRASRRLILLLDGLNEMPHTDYAERVASIQAELDRYADEVVVVTCRPLDYVVKLKRLQKIEVTPLDEARIRTFLHNYLGEAAGERLFWRMAGGEEIEELWEVWEAAGGAWDAFWTAEEMPRNVYDHTTLVQDRAWRTLRDSFPPLLAMGRNPYLLRMTVQVYMGADERIPTNRARVFRAFVDVLLAREKDRHPEQWIATGQQEKALAGLAYAMQAERGQGTTVETSWAEACLQRTASNGDPARILYLATSATLLDGDETTVRFYHQLLQEYFAAWEMRRRAENGEAFTQYWPPDRWWEPSGWEETAILMLGMTSKAGALIRRLAEVNPVVAARCLTEGDPNVDEAARDFVIAKLIPAMRDEGVPPETRAQAGRALAKLGDPRPGVGVREDGVPDIEWCEVPAGPFLMGSSEDDTEAYNDEKPQHELSLPTYYVSRYPVTVAQFRAFVEDSGREVDERSLNDPDNHPVRYVNWHDAVAYCRWLTKKLRDVGGVSEPLRTWLQDEGYQVRLPSEAEWEKAARGTDGRRYPWGADADPNRANYDETRIGTISAVGCFPGGMSPYGVEELSGNVLEWTRSLWEDYPYDPTDGREDPDAKGPRVLRGGAFDLNARIVRCADRGWFSPDYRDWDLGVRVVVSPSSRTE
jgi:formylglycine-generating enzyme required for sulfatase activity